MAYGTIDNEIVDLTDDRPVAVRRKRRISTGLADPVYLKTDPHDDSSVDQSILLPSKTPTKPKKRVRFSDPGPETGTASSSTGLTPYLSNTHFTSRDREASPTRRPHRRLIGAKHLSLPTQLTTALPSPSLSPSPGPLSGEMQFAPLRQVLDDRSKRRLRRNNLSEEINNIEAERKSRFQYEHEIQKLRYQLAHARGSEQEHSENAGAENAGTDRIEELEQEIGVLKQEMRDRSTTAEPMSAIPEAGKCSENALEIYVDEEDTLVTPNFGHDDSVLRDISPIEDPSSVNELATQVATQMAMPSAYAETIRAARISLEYLFPGEITLGLMPKNLNSMLDIMVNRLQDLKARAFVAEDNLKTAQTQESNLRGQFNAVLMQLERSRSFAAEMSKRNDQTKADDSRLPLLENKLQAASSKVNELEKDGDEKDSSIKKLQTALETYRLEVSKLEELITTMDSDHMTAMTDLRTEMDEAVADLECHVVAEQRGRREAEQSLDTKTEEVKQLQTRELELKNALNDKQRLLREIEQVLTEERTGREKEVGNLNVTIGQLSSEVAEADQRVVVAEREQAVLLRKLQEERDAGLRAVEDVQAQLAHATRNSDDIKAAHISEVQRRGAEVTEHKGLLTPVSACRFKDVEGYVEVRRGKGRAKRPDSGVVILEEDEDDDTVMADQYD
ncbi:hypothetical protein MMC21_004169 [Puttea exsequens]|nr:hypothetical protein [Puttea exsequens]